jgi:predicted RNA binding protein YcfA (HicA-like mRNA interferase family)
VAIDGGRAVCDPDDAVRAGLEADRPEWKRMPRKVRELIRELERAGFVNRGGRGSHRNYEHPRGARVTISGQEGDDAKPYQEREVRQAVAQAQANGCDGEAGS